MGFQRGFAIDIEHLFLHMLGLYTSLLRSICSINLPNYLLVYLLSVKILEFLDESHSPWEIPHGK